jgi:uncharacterized membrane protein
MGKRSRKRPAPEGPAATRAERDARRAAPARSSSRRGSRELPPAPWGTFPLTELVVLVALIMGIVGFLNFDSHRGQVAVVCAMALGSLGGLEVSIREHFGGFRSHSTLLAACVAVASMMIVTVAGRRSLPALGIAVAVGVLAFVLAFWGLREAFRRRSGGLGFR